MRSSSGLGLGIAFAQIELSLILPGVRIAPD